MRLEWRLIVGAVAALALGTLFAEAYTRLAIPYYSLVAHWIGAEHSWQITGLDIAPNESGPGAVLRLSGALPGSDGDAQPAAILTSKLQVAAVVESPVIFWACLLMWPVSSSRERLALLALGLPMFLGLEAATTICQLLGPFAYGSAVLGGEPDPVTLWERWSRFLEGGGRIALALCSAMLAIAVAHRVWQRPHGLSYVSRYAR
jgi:hypothetical protein